MDVDETALELYTVQETAAKMRLGEKTIWRLCHSGELESIKVGRRRLIPPQAIANYIASKRAGAPDAA